MKLDDTAKNYDGNQSRISFFLQQCAEMDALPIEKRKDALAFARAMTALEGLPVKEETERNLQRWAKGEKRFTDFYMESLQGYAVIEDYHVADYKEQPHTYMEDSE